MSPPTKKRGPVGVTGHSPKPASGKRASGTKATEPSAADVAQAASDAHAHGLNVLPPRQDGSKAPDDHRWKSRQHRMSTSAEVERWYADGKRTGVGLVCGAVSGGLELLEFEGRAVAEGLPDEFFAAAKGVGLASVVRKIANGYKERTPSGGIHLLYRCSETKTHPLARREATEAELRENPEQKIKVLIETKGEGGYVVVAPSHGKVHPSGKPWLLEGGGFDSIATITTDEREALLRLARSFDRMPPKKAASAPAPKVEGDRPGDLFNEQASWTDVLEPHGWTQLYTRSGVTYWCRPGKTGAVSATTGHGGHDVLYVFSTSTDFEADKAYEKFTAYALLNHEGDFSAAAEQLHKDGYRSDSKRPDADRRFLLRRMDDVETRSIEWFWHHRIPFGKITNVEGDPENGKSLLTLTLAALASTGGVFPDRAKCDPCAVLLICDEDDYEDTIVPRLVAAGADRSFIFGLHPEKAADGTLIPFFMPDDLPALESYIKEVQNLTGRDRVVLIIDPVTSCLSEKINSGVDASVRRALSPLQQLARDTAAAVLLIRHLNKNTSEKNVKYRGGGSIGFFAAARAVLVVGADPRDPSLRVLAQGKKNLAQEMPSLAYRIDSWDTDPELPVIAWQGECDLDAAALLNGVDGRKQSPERDRCKEVLVALLEAGNGVLKAETAKKEAKKAGASDKTMQRAADDLGLLSRAVRNADGTVDYWEWHQPVNGTKVTFRMSGGAE